MAAGVVAKMSMTIKCDDDWEGWSREARLADGPVAYDHDVGPVWVTSGPHDDVGHNRTLLHTSPSTTPSTPECESTEARLTDGPEACDHDAGPV